MAAKEKKSLYGAFLEEREEILRHKYLRSEELGRDMGFEEALLEWVRDHREAWRKSRGLPSGAAAEPPQGQGTE